MSEGLVWLVVIGLAAAIVGELDVHWCRTRRQHKVPEDVQ